jgi:hypothetical protein
MARFARSPSEGRPRRRPRTIILRIAYMRPAVFLSCLLTAASASFAGDEVYRLGPDSHRQEDVPEGTVAEHVWKESQVFPGTIRRYWVYVPAQYKESEPAAVMVFQDGHAHLPKGSSGPRS